MRNGDASEQQNGAAAPAAQSGQPAALQVVSRSAAETAALGRLLGENCHGNEVILLEGDLGAGKTTLAQGLAAGLGVTEPVVSPTFVILREYHGRLPLFHFDFYRLGGSGRAVDLEFEEYLEAGGVCVIEWPGSAPELEPAAFLRVALAASGEGERRLTFEALGDTATRLLRAVAAGDEGKATHAHPGA